jgi:predicted TIM-barrel enzyme
VTGEPPALVDLAEARRGALDVPVLVGSGFDRENALALLSIADGAIVGTSLKSGSAIDPEKVKELVRRIES